MRLFILFALLPSAIYAMENDHKKEMDSEVTLYHIPKDVIIHHILFPSHEKDFETIKKQVCMAVKFARTSKWAYTLVAESCNAYKNLIEHANAVDRNGNTPLIRSIQDNNLIEVMRLINNGAYINKMSSNNTTPLYIAVLNNKTEMVSVLLKKGANPNIMGSSGRSLLFWARHNDNKKIEDLLLEYKASDISPWRKNLCEIVKNSLLYCPDYTYHYYPLHITGHMSHYL